MIAKIVKIDCELCLETQGKFQPMLAQVKENKVCLMKGLSECQGEIIAKY